MVNLITGPKGSGKTQVMIDLANQRVKSANGNVVLIKKSNRDTYTCDFNVRVISMSEYKDIQTIEEFVGFIYGMLAGNHDIESIFIDGVLKQANISKDSLADFLKLVDKISKDNNIEFYLSIAAEKKDLVNIDEATYNYLQ